MKINTSTLTTAAALAFAGFAAWFVLRGPGQSALAASGAAQRTAGLQLWYDGIDAQQKGISGQAPGFYVDILKRRGIL